MLKALLFLSIVFCLNAVDMGKAHEEGMALANTRKGDATNKVNSINKSDVPGYRTDTPHEINLDQKFVKEAADRKAQEDEAASYIQKQSSDPNRKKFNVENENFLINAEQATENPIKTMNEIVMEEQGSGTVLDATFMCEESGQEYKATCKKWLEIELKIIPEHYSEERYCNGHWESKLWGKKKWCHPGCQTRRIKIADKKVEVVREEWKTDCDHLEALSEKGFCVYGTKEVGGQETRTLQEEPVTRPSWAERYTYICKKEVPKEKLCDALKVKRCQQINSKCLEFVNGVCAHWQFTYRCLSLQSKKMTTYKSAGKSAFCLTGNCADTTYPVNTEMMDAFSHLAILKQAQEDNKNNIGIFKGHGCHCAKHCLNFTDCCGGNGGWGVDIGLSRCSQQEKELLDYRKKGHCIELGEYCAERFLGACVRKKRGFCCFGSKLSKTIQEQGRLQLGFGFGSAKYPDCRALTTDELSRLDFSKMDLTPLYEDINQKMKVPNQGHMAKGVELDRIKENMKMLTDKTRMPS